MPKEIIPGLRGPQRTGDISLPAAPAGGDWFAQQDADWFSMMDKQFDEENRQQIHGSGMGTGAGVPAPPGPGRGMGAGPMGQGGPAGAAQMGPGGEVLRGPDVVGHLRENLPMMGGIIGGGLAATASGGLSIPVQIALGLASSAGGATVGHIGREQLRADVSGVPQPPSGNRMLESAIVDGIAPEVMGAAASTAARTGMNVASRVGAMARNRATVGRLADPDGVLATSSPAAGEVGKPMQQFRALRREGAKEPVRQRYNTLLKSPYGSARRLQYQEHGAGEPYVTAEGPGWFDVADAPGPRVVEETPTSFTIEEPPTHFSVTEKGPTFAQRHQRRSDALEDARAYEKSGEKPKAARRARERSKGELEQMKKIAKENGMDFNQYQSINDAYREVAELHDNPFMKQLDGKKGSNMLDVLLNPTRWKAPRAAIDPEMPDIKIHKDNPELVRLLKDQINDDEVWQTLTTAVQKRLVRQSTDMHGNVQSKVLAKKLRQMVDYGAKDLVPNHKELLEFARILDEHTGGPLAVPTHKDMGMTSRLLKMFKLDNALSTPDVGRIMGQRANPGFSGRERIAGRAAQGAVAAGTTAVRSRNNAVRPGTSGRQRTEDIELIPEPPNR